MIGYARTLSSLGIVVGGLAAFSSSAGAQVASAILRDGDALDKGLTVTSVSNTAVNAAGGFALTINTTDGATTRSHVWGNFGAGPGAIIRTEGVYSGLTQTGFETFFGIGLSNVGYSPSGSDGPVGMFDSVFRDDDVIMVEGAAHPLLPGLFWRFGSRPSITSNGRVWFVGGLSTTADGNTSSRGLFTGGDSDEVILMSGDMVPGLSEPLDTGTAVDFDFRVSGNGEHYIAPVALTGLSATDAAVVIDGAAAMAGGSILREGTIVPLEAGGNGTGAYAAFDFMGITDDGRWMVTGDTNAPTTADEYVMVDGVMVLRDGAVIGSDTVRGDIEGAYFNNDADYAVVWDIIKPSREVLIVNGAIVLREGEPVDWDGDGIADAGTALTNFSGISAISLSGRDAGMVHVYFTADIDVNGAEMEGAFRLRVQVGGEPCACDWDADGQLNSQDFFDFLADFFTDAADFNNDGTTNSQDFFDFLGCFFAGC